MSNPVDRDLGPLLYAPKSVRNDQRVQEVVRVQEVIKEIQEFIEPEFLRPPPTASKKLSESKKLSRKSKNLSNQNSSDRRPLRLSTGVCRARSSRP